MIFPAELRLTYMVSPAFSCNPRRIGRSPPCGSGLEVRKKFSKSLLTATSWFARLAVVAAGSRLTRHTPLAAVAAPTNRLSLSTVQGRPFAAALKMKLIALS
jgi:hypothetical protein